MATSSNPARAPTYGHYRKVTRVSGRRLILTLGIWLGVLLVLAVATLLGSRWLLAGWEASHVPDLIAILSWEFYGALLAALLVCFGGFCGLRDVLGFHWTRGRDVGLGMLVWGFALVLGTVATGFTSRLLGAAQSNTVPLLKLSFDPLFVGLMVPVICLVGPAAEELLFRGALYGWLRGVMPIPVAGAVAAAAFAGAHLTPPLLPLLFIFGLAAVIVYQRTGSTFNTFVMHASQNTLAVLGAYLVLSGRG